MADSDFAKLPVTAKSTLLGSITINSSFLLLGQVTVTLAGFAFWTLAAQSGAVSEIGIAASLVSTSSLVAAISLFGANQGVVKFLPTSESKKQLLRTIVSVVGLSSLVLASLAFVFLSSASDFESNVFWFFAIFVLNSFVVSVNIVIDSAMLSYGKTSRNLVHYLISSALCLMALPLLSSWGAVGILAANCILFGGNLALNFESLRRSGAVSLMPSFRIATLKSFVPFVGASYASGVFWITPVLSLPFIVLLQLGEQSVGLMAMSLTLFNALLLFPAASSQALFASLSSSTVNEKAQVKRALRDTLLTTICASAVLAVLGQWVLSLFGEEYAQNGYELLLFLIPSATVASVNLVCNVRLKVHGHLWVLIAVTFLGAAVSMIVWVSTLSTLGLLAVPLGLILGHLVMLSAHGVAALWRRNS
jgi:O-antigen/teichoic acid export membrane protein